MAGTIQIAFCADRRVLPGLHVAAYSVVANHDDNHSRVHLHVFSDEITAADVDLLRKTLNGTRKQYSLDFHSVSSALFSDFPSMSGSWGAYLRLLVPSILSVERIIYLDVDIVCHLDVADLADVDLANHPAGFVAESTIGKAPDRTIIKLMPDQGDLPYFNSGVMVVNRELWQRKNITERCLSFLKDAKVESHDQSALNYILLRDWQQLDSHFNFISNWRKNWPSLRNEALSRGNLIHFLDFPKPWDLGAEIIHPHYQLWRSVLDKTEMRDFRSWHNTASRKIHMSQKAKTGYKKALKDRFLFNGFSRGWLKSVKGL